MIEKRTSVDRSLLEASWTNLYTYQPAARQLKEVMLALNQVTNFQPLLLRYYIDNYMSEFKLQNSTISFENVYEAFIRFQEARAHIQIQFCQSSLPLIDESDPISQHYPSNKANIGNYLRDHYEHFKNSIEKYRDKSSSVGRNICSAEVHSFLNALFALRNMCFLKNASCSQSFLSEPETGTIIENMLFEYHQKTGDIPMTQVPQEELILSEEDVIDFIEFWIRKDPSMCVLYRLTSEGLAQATAQLNSYAKVKQQSQATNQIQIVKAGQQGQQRLVKKTTSIEQEEPIKTQLTSSLLGQIKKYQSMLQKTSIQEERAAILNLIITLQQKYSSLTKQQLGQKVNQKSFVKLATEADSQEIMSIRPSFQRKLEDTFYTYCRKRYALSKHTTFDMIQHEGQVMSFQKFFDFCSDYGVKVERQAVRSVFKKHALNRREIDYTRFTKLLDQLYQINDGLRQNLENSILRAASMDKSRRRVQQGDKPKASYQFKIVPHSGKTEQQIKDQLRLRRQEKQATRQQHFITKLKQEVSYLNKVGLRDKAVQLIQTNSKKQKDLSFNGLLPPQRNSEKLTILNLHKFKDKKFDPASIVDGAHDEYLTFLKLTEPPQIRPQHSQSKKMTIINSEGSTSPVARRGRTTSKKEISEIRIREITDQSSKKQQSILTGAMKSRDRQIQSGLKILNKFKNLN